MLSLRAAVVMVSLHSTRIVTKVTKTVGYKESFDLNLSIFKEPFFFSIMWDSTRQQSTC